MKNKKIVLCNRSNHSNCLLEALGILETVESTSYVITKGQIRKVEREIMQPNTTDCNFFMNTFLMNGCEYGLITLRGGN